MIDLITYALLRKQISEAATGIEDIRAEGDNLIFILPGGREITVPVPQSGVRNAEVRGEDLVLTLPDGSELIYAPPGGASLPLSVVDGMLQITFETEDEDR